MAILISDSFKIRESTSDEWEGILFSINSSGVPAGGSTGQVLKKKSATDYDTEWSNAGTADALPLAGGTMSGNINMDGNCVQNLPTPSANGDAAPKGYTDGIVSVSDTQPTASQNKLWVDTDANPGESYQVPTVAEALALGIAGASVGDLVRVNAVDSNGKPTSWKHVPLCEVKTNPNLLDNWYFVGGGSQLGYGTFPINQRGYSTYTNAGYCIDRWFNTDTVTLTTDGLAMSGSDVLYQVISVEQCKNLLGKKLTFSVLADEILHSASYTMPNSFPNPGALIDIGLVGIGLYLSSTYIQILRISQSAFNNIAAAKVELGSTQTLAHQENGAWVLNEVPDYNEQLTKCRQYFRVLESSPGVGNGQYIVGIRGYSGASTVLINVEPPMAKIITPSLPSGLQGAAVDGAGTAVNLSDVVAVGSDRTFAFSLANNLARTPISVYCNSIIYLSAEL